MLELQNYLQERKALQKNSQLADTAQSLRELRETIARAEQEYEGLQQSAVKAQLDAKEVELQVNRMMDQIKGGKEKLYGAKGSGIKELLSLQQSLQKMEEDAQKGEARYWEMLKEAEGFTAKQKEVREIVKTLKAQYNQKVREYKEEKQRIELKIAEVQNREEEAASRLTKQNLLIFRTAEQKYPTNPVALFRGGNCSGCHISIPSFLAMQIKEAKNICYCDNCGRILVQ